MIKEGDEITLKYKITPYESVKKISANMNSQSEYILKASVKEFDRIEGKILIERDKNTEPFPKKENAWRYRWYFSGAEYAHTDRFSFVVSVVINRQLIENNKVDSHKLESWVKTEILAEFPAHVSMIIHWLPSDQFRNFASTYKRWQNNGAALGDEAYHILEMLTLGRLPSALTGTGNMRIATKEQRAEVIGETEKEWNYKFIESNQLLYVPKIQEDISRNKEN